MKKYIKLFIVFLLVITLSGKSKNNIFTEKFKENIISRVANEVITGIVVGVITSEGTSFYSY